MGIINGDGSAKTVPQYMHGFHIKCLEDSSQFHDIVEHGDFNVTVDTTGGRGGKSIRPPRMALVVQDEWYVFGQGHQPLQLIAALSWTSMYTNQSFSIGHHPVQTGLSWSTNQYCPGHERGHVGGHTMHLRAGQEQ